MNSPHSESEIFRVAIQLESENRAAFLDQACGENRRLRDDVESLLRAHNPEDSFLQSPVLAATLAASVSGSPGESVGTFVGPYKIREQIGEGGFGVVYVAEQEKPVRRKVALKVIKLGMDTRDVIARFEAERQALALMDHPNVARVLDAGTTENGRPYFVMELVHGVKITEYCDRNRLSARARVELFIDVCRAVQHAHQKGIIHRDLKPSNIMVTLHDSKPVVKIIDFGVSKAVSQQLTEKSIYTAYGQMIGTPSYMSPEQAEMSGLGIDTRSDIYSLGVLLYELLTGRTPLDANRLRASGYAEIMRIIREEDPPRPSQRLTTLGDQATVVAEARHTDLQQLRRDLSGDLDWIVMKCLEKDRSRRYETANGLARDIERFLDNEPVEACPPSTSYRLTKAMQKHRTLFLTAGAFLVLLMAAATLASWLAWRATLAERKAQAARLETETALHNEQLARELAESAKVRAQSFSRRLREATQLTDEGLEQFNRGSWAEAFEKFQRAEEVESELWSIPAHRSTLYLRLGLWDEAKRDYDERRRIAPRADSRTLFEHAVLQLATNDEAGYRDTCQRLLQLADGWEGNFFLIRACGLSQDSGVSPGDVARRAENRLTSQFSGFNHFLAWRAQLRANDLSAAQDQLKSEPPLPSDRPGGAHRLRNAYRAMLLHELGQTAEARSRLAMAEDALDEWTEERINGGLGSFPIDWWDLLEAEIAIREARSRLGLPQAEDPRQATLREQSLNAIYRGDAHIHMAQGRRFLEQENYFDATDSFARVLDNMPRVGKRASRETLYCLEIVQSPQMFAALTELRPDDSRLWLARGRWFAAQRQWEKAVADYQQGLRRLEKQNPLEETRRSLGLERQRANLILELAAILLLMEKEPEYQRLCADAAKQASQFQDGFSISSLARACTLSEKGANDPSIPVRWGTQAVDAEPDLAWVLFSLAIAKYRAGDFAGAQQVCNRSLAIHPTWYGRGQNYLLLAMACQRRDQSDEAQAWLSKARAWIAQIDRDQDEKGLNMAASPYLSDWLISQVLLTEAEALLK